MIVGLVLLASIILVVWLIDTDGLVVLLSVCFLFGMFFVVSLMDSPFWWKASPLSKVVEHAGRLHSFLKDYLQEQYPELEFAIVPAETAPPKDASVDYSHYAQRLSELQNQYDALSRRIRDLDRDIGMSIDSFRKGTLVEQRDQLIDERDSIADEMAQIERKLQGRNRR